MSIGLLVIDK